MHPDALSQLARNQRRHWWFTSRALFVRALARSMRDLPPHGRMLDVGTGAGDFSTHEGMPWPTDLRILAMDITREALEILPPDPRLTLLQADAGRIPLRDGSCDAAVIGGMLYHRRVADPERVIREVFRILKPGGRLLTLEPALQFLWGDHDRFFHSGRRFHLPAFRRMIRRCGFRRVMGRYLFAASIPPLVIRRAWAQRGEEARPDFGSLPSWAHRGLIRWHQVEAWLSLIIPLPFGSSVLVLGRKET
jgi:ubiquinone/menaquinone biosynthesis C-methylase UbiE